MNTFRIIILYLLIFSQKSFGADAIRVLFKAEGSVSSVSEVKELDNGQLILDGVSWELDRSVPRQAVLIRKIFKEGEVFSTSYITGVGNYDYIGRLHKIMGKGESVGTNEFFLDIQKWSQKADDPLPDK